MTSKVPLYNLDAEIALLGGCLQYPKYISQVANLIKPEDFYRKGHVHICEALFQLRGETDLVTVSNYLRSKNLLEKCGGEEYVASLINAVSTGAGYAKHAEIVKDHARRRNLIQVCQLTMERACDLTSDIHETEADLKSNLRSKGNHGQEDYVENSELVNAAYEIIGERQRTKDHRVGILTGYKNIDTRIHGMERKTTYYLKGESGMGKSALALNIGENIASENDGTIFYITLESTALALTFRRISHRSRIALTRIRTGNIKSEAEWEKLTRTCSELYNNQMILIEHSRFRWFENIQAFCESYAMSDNILMVIIDFLQLMRTRVRQNSRHLELSYISDSLNYLAKDLNCPILILSQVNKEYETKESRDTENNADNVWEIRRETKESEFATIRATKGKDSGTWQTSLRFDRYIQRFYDCDEQYEAPFGD